MRSRSPSSPSSVGWLAWLGLLVAVVMLGWMVLAFYDVVTHLGGS